MSAAQRGVPKNWTPEGLARAAASRFKPGHRPASVGSAFAGCAAIATALAWVIGRPGVASTLMGVSRAKQVTDNIAALDVVLSADHRAALDAVSAPEPRLLYGLQSREMRRQVVFGGASVRAWGEL